MSEATRRMAFFEIGQGSLLKEFQNLFEQAQIEAYERKCKVTCSLKIEISGPSVNSPRFGSVSFEMAMKVPKRKSIDFTTEVVDGIIVDDGKSENDLMQLKMDLQFPESNNTVPMKGNGTHE